MRSPDVAMECGHQWEPKPDEVIRYEGGMEEPARGAHRCIKHHSHVQDITDDDHECCCGANTWETP